jgi:hypothetical protein
LRFFATDKPTEEGGNSTEQLFDKTKHLPILLALDEFNGVAKDGSQLFQL